MGWGSLLTEPLQTSQTAHHTSARSPKTPLKETRYVSQSRLHFLWSSASRGEELTRVVITDGWFQKAPSILGAPGTDHLQTGTVSIPGSEALGVLSRHTGRRTIRPTEHNRDGLPAGRHVVGLGGGVDDLIDGLHGEVEGHELTDWPQTGLKEDVMG